MDCWFNSLLSLVDVWLDCGDDNLEVAAVWTKAEKGLRKHQCKEQECATIGGKLLLLEDWPLVQPQK